MDIKTIDARAEIRKAVLAAAGGASAATATGLVIGRPVWWPYLIGVAVFLAMAYALAAERGEREESPAETAEEGADAVPESA